ncbi:MAG: GNAT family N-acetyltransferase [Trichococcus flocculiformis]|uniref:Acetyltransferase n=1 Tax=bioreactor metagenome TaxID=1076179 RepID=A0A644Y938_9ZZZZ|nr:MULTISPECIES: GNAT family N-acetyltransferase [Trichococcus]CZQ89476.1 acyl-coa n-acyltransferase [Trichococcus sp. ES5]SHF49400.1 Predicted N-acyltransferase, GNAT family [Trichococcus flocculiformis]HQZ19706.1 GNAT family N-acetyltransferase [Trichococcus flocculiformis]HRA71025.1 GNAT family N-acetyltransferase [Trichococcus flocculiformis]HRL00740.1 GNAT family N-acetyltransferase [Trichococcus flocculiformis]
MLHFEWTQNLKSKTYKDALDIRKEVFVEEQQVPVSIEIDDLEDKTLHLVGYEKSIPVATARIYPMENGKYKVQRVAIRKVVREKKYGSILMQEIERYIRELGGKRLFLGAQNHAIGFYEKVGYTICGEEYEEAGILHHDMDKMIERDESRVEIEH